ncbi:MAG TPA: hypothetical protein GX707_20930 [Epulopiscium sp.]|nr:hypothetical protein [Candidatus Epulonipiscium sp.]
MAKELGWSECGRKVYGLKKDFENEQDFIDTVKNQYDDVEITITDIKTEPCIFTTREIPADTLVPLSDIEITIESFITGIIEEED